MNLLLSMGDFGHDRGVLVVVDLAAGRAEVVLDYRPPPHLRVTGKGFAGASWVGEPGNSELLVCGFAAVYRVDPTAWQVRGILHQPCMNDLHHVTVTDQRIHVANTGLDAIDVFELDGQFVGSHACAPAWLARHRQDGEHVAREDWARLLRPGWSGHPLVWRARELTGSYYRQRADSDRPFHQRVVRDFIHPNHLLAVGDRLLCTRLADRSVVDMRTFRRVVGDTPGHPHDGVLHAGWLFLTCVNGWIVGYESGPGEPWRETCRIDVFAASGRHGWCRGLLVDDQHFAVGLTAIVGPARYPWNERVPTVRASDTETALLLLDRKSGRLRQHVALAGVSPQGKLYSILPMP